MTDPAPIAEGVQEREQIAWQLYLVNPRYGRFRLATRRLPHGGWVSKTVECKM